MSADGDFLRECRRTAEELIEATEDTDRFILLVELFQRAANNVRLADAEREAWLWGCNAEALETADRRQANLADFGPLTTGDTE